MARQWMVTGDVHVIRIYHKYEGGIEKSVRGITGLPGDDNR